MRDKQCLLDVKHNMKTLDFFTAVWLLHSPTPVPIRLPFQLNDSVNIKAKPK